MLSNKEYRALVLLRTLAESGTLTQPKLLEILPGEWERLGLDREYPFGFRSAPYVNQAATMLREAGLMVSGVPVKNVRGDRRPRALTQVPYALTEEGQALAATLTDDWRTWPSITKQKA